MVSTESRRNIRRSQIFRQLKDRMGKDGVDVYHIRKLSPEEAVVITYMLLKELEEQGKTGERVGVYVIQHMLSKVGLSKVDVKTVIEDMYRKHVGGEWASKQMPFPAKLDEIIKKRGKENLKERIMRKLKKFSTK